MARPSKFNAEKWAKLEPQLLAAAKKGASMAKLSIIADIPRPTLHRWDDEHKDVMDTLAKCKALAQQYHEDIADRLAAGKQSGDGATLRFLMMNRHRQDYASERTENVNKNETKLSVDDAVNIIMNNSEAMQEMLRRIQDDGK